jgi:hypothetical protein
METKITTHYFKAGAQKKHHSISRQIKQAERLRVHFLKAEGGQYGYT